MIINEFEWDDNKNESNKKKHGIDFNDVKEVFKDKDKKIEADSRKDYGEERWKLIGKLLEYIIAIIYTVRGTVTRIISARPASRKEKAEYNNQKELKNKEQNKNEK